MATTRHGSGSPGAAPARALTLAASLLLVAAAAAPQGTDADGPLGAWTPPPCVGLFSDVPCSGTGSQFAAWIEQFSRDAITSGCGAGTYCPDSGVTRRQMAVFVERAMRGSSAWPPHVVLAFHRPAAEAGSDTSSGADLLAMVAAIPTTGAEAPSSTNPWLIRVGPGTFDLGSGSLTLPDYTALEGAGQDMTVITAAGYADEVHGTIIATGHNRLSRLTVNNTGGGANAIAVYILPSAISVGLDHMALNANQASNASGATVAVRADTGAYFWLEHCTLQASGAYGNTGVEAASSGTTRLFNVDVAVWGSNPSGTTRGLEVFGGSTMVKDSRFQAQDGGSPIGLRVIGTTDVRNTVVTAYGTNGIAVYNDGPATVHGSRLTGQLWMLNETFATARVVASELMGATFDASPGNLDCYGNYAQPGGFLTNTCP